MPVFVTLVFETPTFPSGLVEYNESASRAKK